MPSILKVLNSSSGTSTAIAIFILIGSAEAQNVQIQNEEVRKDFQEKLTFQFSLERKEGISQGWWGRVTEQERRTLSIRRAWAESDHGLCAPIRCLNFILRTTGKQGDAVGEGSRDHVHAFHDITL